MQESSILEWVQWYSIYDALYNSDNATTQELLEWTKTFEEDRKMINDVFSRVSKDLQKEYEETLSESVEVTNKTIVNLFHEFPLILLLRSSYH